MEMDEKIIELPDDNAPLYQWTEDQLELLKVLKKEDEEIIM